MGFSSARLAPYYFRSAIISRDHFVYEWAVATCNWIAETQLIDSRQFKKKSKEHESTTQTTTIGYRSLEACTVSWRGGCSQPPPVLNEEANSFPPRSPSANRPDPHLEKPLFRRNSPRQRNSYPSIHGLSSGIMVIAHALSVATAFVPESAISGFT